MTCHFKSKKTAFSTSYSGFEFDKLKTTSMARKRIPVEQLLRFQPHQSHQIGEVWICLSISPSSDLHPLAFGHFQTHDIQFWWIALPMHSQCQSRHQWSTHASRCPFWSHFLSSFQKLDLLFPGSSFQRGMSQIAKYKGKKERKVGVGEVYVCISIIPPKICIIAVSTSCTPRTGSLRPIYITDVALNPMPIPCPIHSLMLLSLQTVKRRFLAVRFYSLKCRSPKRIPRLKPKALVLNLN